MIEEGADGSLDTRLRPTSRRVDVAVHKRPSGRTHHAEPDGTIDIEPGRRSGRATPCAAHQARAPRPSRRVPSGNRRTSGRQADARHRVLRPAASLLQARTVNEVVKAQTNKVRLARLGR